MDAVTQLAANTNRYQPLPVSQSRDPNRERVKGKGSCPRIEDCSGQLPPFSQGSANL